MTVSITFQQRLLLLLLLLYCRACVRGVCTPAVADPAHITLGRAAYTVCVNSFFLSLSLFVFFFFLSLPNTFHASLPVWLGHHTGFIRDINWHLLCPWRCCTVLAARWSNGPMRKLVTVPRALFFHCRFDFISLCRWLESWPSRTRVGGSSHFVPPRPSPQLHVFFFFFLVINNRLVAVAASIAGPASAANHSIWHGNPETRSVPIQTTPCYDEPIGGNPAETIKCSAPLHLQIEPGGAAAAAAAAREQSYYSPVSTSFYPREWSGFGQLLKLFRIVGLVSIFSLFLYSLSLSLFFSKRRREDWATFKVS